MFESNGHIIVDSPGAGADNLWAPKCFININFQSVWSFAVSFSH